MLKALLASDGGALPRVAREESRRRGVACCYWDVHMLLTSEAWLESTNRRGPVQASFFRGASSAWCLSTRCSYCSFTLASLTVTDTINTYIAKSFERLLDIWSSFAPERRAVATAHLIRGGTIERIRGTGGARWRKSTSPRCARAGSPAAAAVNGGSDRPELFCTVAAGPLPRANDGPDRRGTPAMTPEDFRRLHRVLAGSNLDQASDLDCARLTRNGPRYGRANSIDPLRHGADLSGGNDHDPTPYYRGTHAHAR